MMSPQQERGLRILSQDGLVIQTPQGWRVKSESRDISYHVDPDKSACTCPDFRQHGQPCKHVWAVQFALYLRDIPEETAPARRTYSQNWPAYNAAQCSEKPLFINLLHDLCRSVKQPEQRMGRRRLALADMVFAIVYKAYVGFSSRRFTGDLREACKKGMLDRPPHFNSVTNYLSKPELTPVLEQLVTLSSLPLKWFETDFAVDSSGFGTSAFMHWYDRKNETGKGKRGWIKAHVFCGVRTNVIVNAVVSEGSANDSLYFTPLLDRTAGYFGIREVSADKAYLSRLNVEAVANVGAFPFIALKNNTALPRKDGSMWSKMIHLCMLNRDAFLERYHLRSNVETAFSMIKMKFRASVRSRTFAGQANEVLCMVICHNLCVLIQEMFQLGVQPDFLAELQRGDVVVGGSSSQPLDLLAG